MNTYDLIQDLTFSQARDWTGGIKATYHVKDWFSVTGSLHSDFMTALNDTNAGMNGRRYMKAESCNHD